MSLDKRSRVELLIYGKTTQNSMHIAIAKIKNLQGTQCKQSIYLRIPFIPFNKDTWMLLSSPSLNEWIFGLSAIFNQDNTSQ
jgi:hypothetical protein